MKKRTSIPLATLASAVIAISLMSAGRNQAGATNIEHNDTYNPAKEINEAYAYLNAVRQNPAAYSGEIGVNLGSVKSQPKLRWNDTLAKAASDKANDMANRNYFEHVTPEGYGMNYFINKAGYTLVEHFLKKPSNNFFESLAAGNSGGKAAVIQLINDGGATHENAGHRRHLLGMDDFWANCYDIGIGVAYNPNSTYKYYWCFLVAKHDF